MNLFEILLVVIALSAVQQAASFEIPGIHLLDKIHFNISKAEKYVESHWPFKRDTNKHDVVVYRLYRRGYRDTPEVISSNATGTFRTFDKNKPTIVLVHGWRGYGNCKYFLALFRGGLLDVMDANVITVDWSGHGSRSQNYALVKGNVHPVAEKLADFLDRMAGESGLELERTHVIGHSLGAHVSGIAGQLVRRGKLDRVTGLDPAGPLISKSHPERRLSRESANFVDVIHTTDHYLGFTSPLGHVDFYPNGGNPWQPGCGTDVLGRCSHRRSYLYFEETIRNPQAYPAHKCQDWKQFLKRQCDANEVAYMGFYVSRSANGVYFLEAKTDSHDPTHEEKLVK